LNLLARRLAEIAIAFLFVVDGFANRPSLIEILVEITRALLHEDANLRVELLVEDIVRQVRKGVVLRACRFEHLQGVLHAHHGGIDVALGFIGDAAEDVAEIHRVDVGASREQVKPDLATGLNDDEITSGTPRDLAGLVHRFALGGDDERAHA
jgi:predicted alpha-1,6-mannanase (GH76 family)